MDNYEEKYKKALLLKDLSARWPYGVKGIITYDKSNTTFTVEGIDNNVLHLSDAEECYVEDFKSYLRPMRSITEEEIKELSKIDIKRIIFSARHLTWHLDGEIIDYLNKKMLDWRGLIPRGLAIEAPEGMYNIK